MVNLIYVVAKSDNPDPAVASEMATYTSDITSNGSSDAPMLERTFRACKQKK